MFRYSSSDANREYSGSEIIINIASRVSTSSDAEFLCVRLLDQRTSLLNLTFKPLQQSPRSGEAQDVRPLVSSVWQEDWCERENHLTRKWVRVLCALCRRNIKEKVMSKNLRLQVSECMLMFFRPLDGVANMKNRSLNKSRCFYTHLQYDDFFSDLVGQTCVLASEKWQLVLWPRFVVTMLHFEPLWRNIVWTVNELQKLRTIDRRYLFLAFIAKTSFQFSFFSLQKYVNKFTYEI